MTQLLQQAIDEIRKRPDDEQDAIAAMILEQLADEAQWEQAFARTQARLAAWSEQVGEDVRAGRVHRVGIDEL